MSSSRPSPAQELIEENMRTKAPFLDLGNCGLTDDAPPLEMLQQLEHVKGINFGAYYYLEGKKHACTNKYSANGLNRIPPTLPPGIESLYVNLNKIETIGELNLYKDLHFFDAYSNLISDLSILEANPNMQSFGISGNHLLGMDGIASFPNLRFLYIGDNRLRSVPKLSDVSPALHTLFIYGNQLDNIDFLQGNKSLRKIDLSKNKLLDIQGLVEVPWLEEIEASANPLLEKPTEMSILSGSGALLRSWLRKTTLMRSKIQDNQLKKDAFLDLGSSGAGTASEEWAALAASPNLESLSLGDAYFDELGQYFNTSGEMVGNMLPELPKGLPAWLKKLQSRSTQTERISNILHLTKLRLLDLSNNKIMNIGDLSALKQLKELALHGNRIDGIATAIFPKNLKVLHLSSNKITSLEGIENCQELEQLVVYDNLITSIKPILRLPKLKSIELSNNPILDCPSEIWTTNDLTQIRAYFKEMEAADPMMEIKSKVGFIDVVERLEVPPNVDNTVTEDVKLIILGNSATGKTHLVHYLEHGKSLNYRSSTHGLEVKRWRPDAVRFPQLNNVEVSIWDFGGQEYYHDAYKLFLGSNAVYVVMWCQDSDRNGKKDELVKEGGPRVPIDHFEKQYWLDTVKCFRGENSETPFLLVQNKVDDPLTDKKRISQDVHDEYKITESFHISILNGCDDQQPKAVKTLEGFANYLADTLATLAHNNAQFSPDFKFIRNEVLNLSIVGKPSIFGNENNLFIKKKEFIDIASANMVIPNIELYPTWLHKGGVLVYFDTNPLLNDRVFINPKLLSEKIYGLLNNEVLASNGDIPMSAIAPENALIVDVMKSLEMLYPHPNHPDTHYLAPQYMPEDHPIEDLFKIASINAWQDSYWIRVPIFYYKKLMHYLLLSFVADSTTDARYFWKNGIMLLKGGKRILIKGLYPDTQQGVVQVSVEDNSPEMQKSIFDTVLKFRVQGLGEDATPNASMSKNAKEEMTPQQKLFREKLELSVDQTHYFNYNTLEALVKANPQDANTVALPFKNIVPFAIVGGDPKNVFVSYSHSNAIWLVKIKNHLSVLRRKGLIKEWTDQEIMAGEKWDLKIKEQMKKADIFILLLSAEFIASDYIWKVELREVFESKKTIIPIYIESCDFAGLPNIIDEKIGDFEIIPKDDTRLKPLNLWANEAQGLATVAMRIREVIEKDRKI